MPQHLQVSDQYSRIFDVPQLINSEVVQLGRGSLNARFILAFGQDTLFHYLSASPMFAATQFGSPDWIGILLPISKTGNIKINGVDVSDWVAYHLDGRDKFSSVGEERDNIVISIRRRRLQQAVDGLSGANGSRIDWASRPMDLGRTLMMHLRAVGFQVLADSSAVALESRRALVPPTIEADAIVEIAKRLSPFLVGEHRGVGKARNTRLIVHSARQVVETTATGSPCLAELCRASGVGLTRLQEAFADQYGVSAGRYLQNLPDPGARGLAGRRSASAIREGRFLGVRVHIKRPLCALLPADVRRISIQDVRASEKAPLVDETPARPASSATRSRRIKKGSSPIRAACRRHSTCSRIAASRSSTVINCGGFVDQGFPFAIKS